MKQVLRFLALAALICVPWVTQAQGTTQTFDFEDGLIPAGWTNDATHPWEATNDAANAGTYSIKSGNTGINSSTSSITVTFTFAGDGSISFAARCSSEQSDPSYDWDYGTFYIDGVQQGDKIINSNNFSSYNYNVEAGTHTFMWKYKKDGSVGSNDDCLYIDDVVVDLGVAPSCPRPTGVAASNVSTTGATLTWNVGSEEDWVLQYGTDENFAAYTEVNVSTTPSQAISGLTAQTTYYVRVMADCGGGEESTWSTTYSFTTPCNAVTSFPWSENFESYASGNFAANCWVNEHISGSGSYIFKVYTSTNGTNSTHQLQLPDMSSGTLTKLRLPEMTLPGDNYQFTLDVYRNSSTSNYEEGIRVYVSTDGNIEGATQLAFISRSYTTSDGGLIPAEAASGWYTYELPIGISGTCYIILRGESRFGSPTYMDNLKVSEIPSCLKPTDVTCTATTTTSATLSWTAGGTETAWQICLNDDEAHPIDANTNPFTVTGLTHSTAYTAKVRANCDANGFSDWSTSVANFTTECEAVAALGFTENFDGTAVASAYTPTARTLPTCWKYINECTHSSYKYYPTIYYYSYTDYSHSSPNSLRFYSYYSGYTDYDPQPQYAILPVMTGLSGKQVTLMAKGYDANSTFKIGTMSDPTDASTFEPIEITSGGYEQALTTSYQEFEYVVPTTTDAYLAIMIDAAASPRYTNGVYIDDISIAEPPTCLKPSGLAKSNVAARQVDLSWTKGDAETDWDICINDNEGALVSIDESDVTVTGSSVSYTLTGLYPETAHTVKVRANCGGGNGVSQWSNEVSFTTTVACPAPTSPSVNTITAHTAKYTWIGSNATPDYVVSYRTAAYTEGFEEEFNTNSIPTGWTRYSGLVDQVIAGTATLTSGTSWTNNSYALGSYNYKLNIYGTDCKHWLITPEISIESGYSFSFDLALTDYGNSDPIEDNTAQSDDRFVVLVYADDAWTILREWNNGSSSYVYNNIATDGESVNDIDISGYVGKTVKFAFYGESTASGGDNDLHIDNVAVGIAHVAGEWQTVDVDDSGDDTPAAEETLTNLAAETKYDVKVKANCTASSDGYSLETSIVTFTTLAGNQKPTDVEVDPVTLSSSTATVSWTGNGCSDHHVSYDVYYATSDVAEVPATPAAPNLITGVTETSKTITGLDAETEYKVWVRDNCGTDGVSDWSAAVTFTTLANCPQPTAVAVSNIGTHVADVEWTGIPEYTVKYRTSAYMDGIEETFGTSLPSGWENKTGLLSDVMGGTALASGSQWYFGENNGVFDNHARINIYGSGSSERKGWLITPTFTLPVGATMSFDLALTAYSGTLGAPATTGTDDRFVVLVYADDAWHILREWNNSGSTYVYNDIPCAATGETVDDIDISAYEGKTVRFAFYGESTVSNADNNLHIDNVIIGTPVPAGTWSTIEDVDANSITLTGLDAGTKYDVVIVPECNTTLASDPVSFTTVALPTLDITANSWYAIASPVHNSGNDETVAEVDNLIATSPVEYDFLRYVEASCKWESYKQHTADFDLEQGRGYIYRRSADATLVFDGEPNRGNVNVNITMDADGWNLVGNPYMKTITCNSNFAGSSTAAFTTGGYRLSANGTWTAIYNTSDIAVGQAVLLKATTAGTLTLTAPAGAKKSASNDEDYSTIAFTVSNDEFTDIAYARFSSEEGLPKISHLNPEAPMLSIDGYAIANLNEGTESFPMSFSGNGEYTLTVSGNTDVTGYLHLVDRLTGRDIDLLSTPSYSFTGSPVSDRFTVKLTPDAEEGLSTSRFAIFDGNSLIVNGEGTLEVYDVMGRRLMSAEVTGSEYRIPGSDLHTGVYVLRMNGNSQKIVIK